MMLDIALPPLTEVITRHLGPAPGRHGDRSSRSWWVCPFHDDNNPSLCVESGKSRYHCFGCGVSGDAIDFVRQLNPSMTFQDALASLGGRPRTRTPRRPLPTITRRLPPRSASVPPARPDAWQEFVQGIVAKASTNLWAGCRWGPATLQYLHRRGLREDTIRAARLGYWEQDEWVAGIFPDGKVSVPRGIVIPWFDGETIEAVNVRLPKATGTPGKRPRKYHLIRGSRRGGLYPGREAIVSGGPLVLAEGEFDTLLLNQELAGLIPAVTLGSAGDRRPTTRTLLAMSATSPWYVASDADGAGLAAADDWLARSGRCRRITPPAGDWTDAHLDGFNLREWWSEWLAGRPPESFDPAWYDTTSPVVEDADGITFNSDPWRWQVANWPHARWAAWRRRATEILTASTSSPTAELVATADRLAYLESPP